jgi:dihydrofolate synthase/folylpolyglutamate synthase
LHKPWNDWSLNQWLYSLENRNTNEIQLGLSRISEVAHKIKVDKVTCKVITVAGTNGKGSTVSALETIYHTAGYKVGAYTSPHLIQFNERVRVNLKPISDEDLCLAFNCIEEARGLTHLTYFEFTTLAALWYFKKLNLDIIILEVGLGGRLDATNIIDADLSIITTIDYDHQDYLGTTLEAIGYEKAGILRQSRPFIYADIEPPSSILDEASRLNAPGYLFNEQFSIKEQDKVWGIQFQNLETLELPKPKIQLKSAAAAIVACWVLQKGLPVTNEHLYSAMTRIFIPGRLQLVQGSINVLYDVAHNAQSARLLAQAIHGLKVNGHVRAVFSALKDKDIFGLISPLKDCVDHWYPAQLDTKRASSAEMLCTVLREAEIFVDICYTSPLIAFQQALNQATPGDLVVVYGSFFTVSQILAVQHNILEQKETL